MTASVRVDQELCQGLGLCVGMAPAQFRLDDARSVPTQLLVSDPASVALLRDVAACCPMEAVEVTVTEGSTP